MAGVGRRHVARADPEDGRRGPAGLHDDRRRRRQRADVPAAAGDHRRHHGTSWDRQSDGDGGREVLRPFRAERHHRPRPGAVGDDHRGLRQPGHPGRRHHGRPAGLAAPRVAGGHLPTRRPDGVPPAGQRWHTAGGHLGPDGRRAAADVSGPAGTGPHHPDHERPRQRHPDGEGPEGGQASGLRLHVHPERAARPRCEPAVAARRRARRGGQRSQLVDHRAAGLAGGVADLGHPGPGRLDTGGLLRCPAGSDVVRRSRRPQPSRPRRRQPSRWRLADRHDRAALPGGPADRRLHAEAGGRLGRPAHVLLRRRHLGRPDARRVRVRRDRPRRGRAVPGGGPPSTDERRPRRPVGRADQRDGSSVRVRPPCHRGLRRSQRPHRPAVDRVRGR